LQLLLNEVTLDLTATLDMNRVIRYGAINLGKGANIELLAINITQNLTLHHHLIGEEFALYKAR
jgi:hypothetical protein